MTKANASKPCPKCGKVFACCVEQGGQCWCASVKLSPTDRSYLASKFDGCLCPDCLKGIKDVGSIRITGITE